MKSYLIVGSGFSGAVLAHQLALTKNAYVDVIDQREHTGGNCHTKRDSTGVMVHVYGPHMFNTNNERVWEFVNKFDKFIPVIHRIKANTDKGVFSMPINLHTINQLFNKKFTPNEAKEFISSLGSKDIEIPQNFEEQALKFLGTEIYETFFYGYTKKQWGCEPRELPASILKRLPVRFNYDDNYHEKRFQGIPENGYSYVIDKMLSHENIKVTLNTKYNKDDAYDHVFYTGPIDEYFNYLYGRLGYRTVEFERFEAEGDIQGAQIITYPNENVPWTRIHEHKHYTPWETHTKSVAFKEYSKETGVNDMPYYPKCLAHDKQMLEKYINAGNMLKNITFLGRLATYRYLDMEAVVGEALELSDMLIFPVFPHLNK